MLDIWEKMSPKNAQGTTMGVYQSAGSLGRIIGPVSAGYLFQHAGSAWPFYVAAMMFGFSFLVIQLKKNIWA